MTHGINKLAKKFASIDYSKPANTNFATKIKFTFCRLIQKQVRQSGVSGIDSEYWLNQGWLEKSRPWKQLKRER